MVSERAPPAERPALRQALAQLTATRALCCMTCAIHCSCRSSWVVLQQRSVLDRGHKRLWSSLSRCQLTLVPFRHTSRSSGVSTTATATSASQLSQSKEAPADVSETPRLAAALLDKGSTDSASCCMMLPYQHVRLTLAALLKAHQEWYSSAAKQLYSAMATQWCTVELLTESLANPNLKHGTQCW